MSKLLIKMLKISLLPAATMVVAKVVGLTIAVNLFNIQIFIDNEVQKFFSVQILSPIPSDTLLLNSFSNLFLLVVMTSVNAYLLVKYVLYVKTEGNPKTIVKLTKLNLLKWVTDKQTVFLKIFVWILFLLAACAIIITSALQGETYSWIGFTALFITIFFMWGLIRAFETEASKIYPKESNDNILY